LQKNVQRDLQDETEFGAVCEWLIDLRKDSVGVAFSSFQISALGGGWQESVLKGGKNMKKVFFFFKQNVGKVGRK